MRSELTDSRTQVVENLVTNPKFERVVAGTTILRRNLHRNPNLATILTGWSGYSSGMTVTSARVVESFNAASAYCRVAITAITNGSVAVYNIYGNITISPGRTYTFSVYGRPSWATSTSANIEWYDSSNGWISTSVGTISAHAKNAIERRSVTATAPANASWGKFIFIRNGGANPVVGDTLDASMGLIEERPGLLPYFDGSTTDNTGITYAWEGTASASTSVIKAASTEVRRNLCTNPNFETDITGWVETAGTAATSSQDTTVYHSGTASQKIVTTTGTGIGRATVTLPVTPGSTITGSVWIYTTVATSLSLTLENYNVSTYVSIMQQSSITTSGSGWQRFSVSGISASSGITGIRFGIRSNTAATWWIDDVLVETSGVVGPYFDGSNTPDADLMPSWLGTTNASVSILSGVQMNTYTGGGGSAPRCVKSFINGVAWGRTIPTPAYAGTDSPMSAGGDVGALRLGMQPGRTYTVLATCKLLAAQTGSLGGGARRIAAYYKTPSTGYVTTLSNAAPNTAGETLLRVTFSLPSDTSEAFIRLFNGGAAGSGDVYWGNFAVIDGVYTGPYLDGDMPNCIWRGTPNNSTSLGYPSGV